jgi:hypothetical protein
MMKRVSKSIACCIAACLLATACKKSDDNTGGEMPDDPYTAMTYPKGALEGTPIQKSIGTAGGTITSADGKISLTIPGGALTTGTNFSIQPVSNTIPLGTGLAFRLLPDNVVFSKPVTIELIYDSASFEGSDEAALDLAYQDNTGTWKALNNTIQDKAKHKLSIQTTHLNDYSMVSYYVLRAGKTTLVANEPTTLTVYKVSTPDDGVAGEETPLGEAKPYQQPAGFEEWKLTGNGAMDASQTVVAVYTAPAAVQELFSIQVATGLKNVRRPQRLTSKKVKLQARIHVVKDDFMAGTYDGHSFNCVLVNPIVGGGKTVIQGVTAKGESVVLITKGTVLNTYPYGDEGINGTSLLSCSIGGGDFQSEYGICGPPASTGYSGGAIIIKSFGERGGIIAGEFSATLYDDAGCNLVSKPISGEFRVRRP